MSDIIFGVASWALMYIDHIYASATKVITTLIIWAMFNTASLFLGVLPLSNKKKYPPDWIITLGKLKYYALI